MAERQSDRPHHVRGKGEPAWWEWLEQRPVGFSSLIAVLLGWALLALLYFRGVWTIDVVFFIAVGWLTLNLSFLSAFAAVVHWFHPDSSGRPDVLRLPEWMTDFEDYFRWLTPVIFIVGIIFGHYFWH
jgi:hypothetical protein